MRLWAVLAVWGLLFAAPEAWADFYKWTDSDGKENYTNDLNKVPQEYRDKAAAIETKDERVSVGQRPVAPYGAPASVGEHRDKYGRGEEYWRKRAANLRLKLRDLQDEYDLVLKQEQEQEQKPQKLNSKKKKLSSLEKKKAKLEKDITKLKRVIEVELPEEARRADAYPGWIRE